ncbi:hypothetical protein JCM10296v2_001442 [Rhodotorula toruloides]
MGSPTSPERHRLLANELFPPSPPANVTSSAAKSPDVIEDSDEERATSQTVMSSKKTGRTTSYEDEGDLLAKRLEMLGLSPVSPLVSEPPAKLSSSTRTRGTRIEADTIVVQETQEGEEVVLVCTDDEEEEEALAAGSGSKPGWWSEDVTETDGILIYDPTPNKRPVRLPPSRASPSSFLEPAKSPAPSSRPACAPKPVHGRRAEKREGTESPAEDAKLRGSKLRVEIDLTGDSSEGVISDGDGNVDDDDPLPPRTPSSTSSVPRLSPKDRQTLPLLLIRELDKSVFRKRWDGLRSLDRKGEVGRGKGLPEGIEIVWSKRLLKTAGRATWKRSRTATTPGSPEKTTTHQALVELSVKVTDTETKLKHTLAHELCHLAAWAIDGEMKPPHGPAFKTWAKRVMLVRPDIEVTTTHSYEIVYKYRWQCTRVTCGKIFSRHSNSINPSTHGCPCGSRIVPIDKDGNVKPQNGAVPSVGGVGGPKTPKTERKKSKWVEFLQAQSPLIRRDNPSLPQSEVFKLAAERWRVVKATSATASVPATPSKKAVTSRSVALDLDSEEEDEGDLGDKLGRLELQ